MSLTINNESFTIINNGKSFEILKDNASLDRSPTRVYMNGFWWDLEKATADGYASLDDLYNTLRDKIDHRYASGGGGGIESIVEGTNITVDDTDPLNPIISVQDITLSGEVTGSTSLSAIDKTAITNKTTETIVGTDYVLFGDTSDGDNLKKGLVSDIVALSGGGGGGTPAGSDNQIQINQSGAFFADSTFQKSDADFNVGLNHTQQSAVTFAGAGLDDLIVAGAFSGTVPTTYTVTIDGVNVDFLVMHTSSITGGSFAVSDVVTNGIGGIATVLGVSTFTPLFGVNTTYLRVNITAGSFAGAETIDNGSGVTGTTQYGTVFDTISINDGVTTTSDVVCINVDGLTINLSATTGHTLTDSWTWTYSTVNQNVLDFSNNDYKFQSVSGTDTFGYHIGDNILGSGLKGSVNTYANTAGDYGYIGLLTQGGSPELYNVINFSTGESLALVLQNNGLFINVYDSTSDSYSQFASPTTFTLKNIISGIGHGISQSAGAVTIGTLSGGNNTKITIDDVNEHITISNLPAYDDDTAAGVGGLTAGMVYMTTGSGSAPLNAAGILMIKQ